jgi:hypothetical protein
VTVLARGWATVELDRAAVELAPLLAPGASFAPAPDCIHLGATCRVGRLAAPDPDVGATHVILLEPYTEGRMAVTLARHGEGWCATWTEEDVTDAGPDTPVSAVRDGPFGPERIVLGGPPSGPHRLVVSTATIDP